MILLSKKERSPKITVEILLGHGKCHIIVETSNHLNPLDVKAIVLRISGNLSIDYVEVPQGSHHSLNQAGKFSCGDNGIFKGVSLTEEKKKLSKIARDINKHYPFDGK